MSAIEYCEAGNLPDDVAKSWRHVRLGLDRVTYLTGSPEWHRMMAGLFGGGGVVVCRDERSNPVTILPVIAGRMRLGIGRGRLGLGKEVRVARICGGDIVARDIADASNYEALRMLLEEQGYDAVIANHVAGRQRAEALMEGCAGRGLVAGYLFRNIPHYRLRLPATYGQFTAMRSKSSMNKLLGRQRAMERERGAIEIVEIRREADWRGREPDIDGLMNSTWQAEELGHAFMLRDSVPVAEMGWFRSFLMSVGGRAAAFVLGYQDGGVFVYERVGYNREFGRYSPGLLLLCRLVEELYRQDTPEYMDFGEGDADYKKWFSNEVTEVSSVAVAERSTKAGFLVRAKHLEVGLMFGYRRMTGALWNRPAK